MPQLAPEQIDAWRSAIRQDTFSSFHYEMGIALEQGGAMTEAIASYQRAIDAKPDHALAYARLINRLDQDGMVREAAMARQAANQFCPDYADRLAEDRVLVEIRAAVVNGRLDEAIGLACKTPVLSARNASVLAELAKALRLCGRGLEAAPLLQKALNIAPLLVEVQREAGFLAWFEQRVDDAEGFLRSARIAHPHDPEIASYLAKCHLVRLDTDGALALTTPHCQVITNDIFLAIAHTSALLISKRWDEGIAFLRILPQVQDVTNSNRPGVLLWIGLLHQAAGRNDKALACYEEALITSSTPSDISIAHNYLGLGYLGAGDLSQSVHHHEQSVTVGFRPNSWSLSNQALTLLALHQDREADALLQQSLSCADAPQIAYYQKLRPQFSDLLEQRYSRLR